MKNRITGWKVCIVIFIILTMLSFSPLIIPQGRHTPELLGIPYTMWTGFLVTLAFVILTLIGMKVHPAAKDKEDQK